MQVVGECLTFCSNLRLCGSCLNNEAQENRLESFFQVSSGRCFARDEQMSVSLLLAGNQKPKPLITTKSGGIAILPVKQTRLQQIVLIGAVGRY